MKGRNGRRRGIVRDRGESRSRFVVSPRNPWTTPSVLSPLFTAIEKCWRATHGHLPAASVPQRMPFHAQSDSERTWLFQQSPQPQQQIPEPGASSSSSPSSSSSSSPGQKLINSPSLPRQPNQPTVIVAGNNVSNQPFRNLPASATSTVERELVASSPTLPEDTEEVQFLWAGKTTSLVGGETQDAAPVAQWWDNPYPSMTYTGYVPVSGHSGAASTATHPNQPPLSLTPNFVLDSFAPTPTSFYSVVVKQEHEEEPEPWIPSTYKGPSLVNDLMSCTYCRAPLDKGELYVCNQAHYPFCGRCKQISCMCGNPLENTSVSHYAIVLNERLGISGFQELKSRCPYFNEGCWETISPTEFVYHLNKCIFRRGFKCFFNCGPTMFLSTEYFQHCKDVHKFSVVQAQQSMSYFIKLPFGQDDNRSFNLVEYDDRKFLFSCGPHGSFFSMSFILFGGGSPDLSYLCQAHFFTPHERTHNGVGTATWEPGRRIIIKSHTPCQLSPKPYGQVDEPIMNFSEFRAKYCYHLPSRPGTLVYNMSITISVNSTGMGEGSF